MYEVFAWELSLLLRKGPNDLNRAVKYAGILYSMSRGLLN